jgi:hypothetical protein
MERYEAEIQETMESKCDDIRDFNLAKILIYLNSNRKTGILRVKTPFFTKKIYLDEGTAIFASSTCEDDRIGEMLVRSGKLKIGQYEESVRLLKMTGKKQGTILVELGFLTPKDLFWSVKYLVKEIICSLFPLEYAAYEFVEGEITKREKMILKLNMGDLIYEGVKRINNFSNIKREMPDLKSPLEVNIVTSIPFDDIEFSPVEKSILSMIDGQKTILEIVDNATADCSPFEVFKSLYVLCLIGVLKKKETKTEEEKTKMTNGVWSLENTLMFSPDLTG